MMMKSISSRTLSAAIAMSALSTLPLAAAETTSISAASSGSAPIDLHDALARAASEGASMSDVPRWQPEPGDQIRFNVLRKGNPFGAHQVTFDEMEDGTLVARTEVNLKAGLGPITVFRYALESEERWRDGKLVALDGDLESSGSDGRVKAVAEGDALKVDGTEFSGEVPLGILPSSHWNVLQTQAETLISTEDGEIIEIDVRRIGEETIAAGGQQIEATRYLMDSDIDVDLWYDEQGRWVKLAFEARGQEIEYVLDTLYQ